MADRRQRLLSLYLTLALGAANLIALNFLVSGWSTARVDLTSEGVFSTSQTTRQILAGLDEDLTIYGYFSERTHPKLAPLVPEIIDLLDEYRAVSGGRVHIEIVDPGQDEAAEEEAADRFGIQSTPFRLASKYESAIVNAYFAVVVRYADQYVRYGFEDLIVVEPGPDGDIDVRLRNLEYDLTRAIKKTVYGFRSTAEVFSRVERPVRLTAIWSPATLPELFQEIPDTVRRAVEELKVQSRGQFVFEEIDPSTDEAAAREAMLKYGARPMSLGLFDDREFYLYALLETDGRTEQLPLTDEGLTVAAVREAVENSLRRNTPGFLKTVGIVAPQEPEIPPQIRMQMQLPPPRPPEFQEIKGILGQDYRVEDVDLAAEGGVPSDVDVLLILKPKDLAEQAVFHLDQYLMRGGRVILCTGNYDVDFGAQGLNLTPIRTGLEDWLEHHGVRVEASLVLDDRNQPLPIPEIRQTPFGNVRTWRLAPYPYLIQVKDEGFLNREIAASLDSVGIYWGSPLHVDEETVAAAGLEVLPLLQSSNRSWTDDDLSRVNYVDYEVPREGTAAQLLAVALSGRFKSYYVDREPPGASASGADSEEDAAPTPPPVALAQSPETRLLVIGDSEFLSDFVARALSQVEGGFFVENLRFAQNLIDWTGLDNDMLSIRSRGIVSSRLDALAPGTEKFVETLSYALPVGLLALLGLFLHWKRRQTVPLTATGLGSRIAASPASKSEA